MADAFKIFTASADQVEALVNEAHEQYQALSFSISVAQDKIWVTVVMINRRELPRPGPGLSLPGMGRPPFGS